MTPRHAPHSAALRQAIILLDRPVVGRDAHHRGERLPDVVRVRATVVGARAVACSIDAAAVGRALGVAEPTWAHLEAAWQLLAASIQHKIRAADFGSAGQDGATVHLAAGDVPEAKVSHCTPRAG